MNEIQVGTTTFKESDFIIAVQDELSCIDCKYNQINLRTLSKTIDWSCYHTDNTQHGYYGERGMGIKDGFLCNRFGLDNDE